MARRYIRPSTRTPSRRERVTFRATAPSGRRERVSFLVRRRRRR